MPRFEFATAGRIIFGPGVLEEIGTAAASIGSKCLITSGMHGRSLDRLVDYLTASSINYEIYPVGSEPSITMVLQAVRAAQSARCDFVIGMGGGSALDMAKATAALLTNPGDPLDYLEVVGRGQKLQAPPAPFIAVPTTAGTGSEVTRNAVLAVPEKQVKVSLRSPMLMARAAIVDPELTYSLPPDVTAATGMDAIAQVIEPYVSRRANALADLYCREGIVRGAHSLLMAYQDGANQSAREDMAFTSLMGGLALANAGLGAVHGFAGVIGGMFHAPHGAVCAALLPSVVKINARALSEREPGNPALSRYREIARMVINDPAATVDHLVDWLEKIREALHIPGLGAYGVHPSDFALLVDKSAPASSMKANPLSLTREEMREILEMAL